MTRKANFTQAEVYRLCKAVQASNLRLKELVIHRCGKLVAHVVPIDENDSLEGH